MPKHKLVIGNCFENAGKLITSPFGMSEAGFGLEHLDGWQLVHGIVTCSAGRFRGRKAAHAWIETDPVVFDAEARMLLIRQAYYDLGKIEQTVRYDRAAAKKIILEKKHWGPWDDRFYDDGLVGPSDVRSN